MTKLISIQNNFLKILMVLAFGVVSTAYVSSSNKKNLFAETTVSIVQENDGFTISVNSSKNINVRFYMFTVEGRLVKELSLHGSNRISITPLEKGIYIYDFFSNDKRLKNGKIVLR